jgi:ribosomal-protein-alanine N-acetyltransferase
MAHMTQTRTMTRADIDAALRIEQAANQFPWSYKNFEGCFKDGYRAWLLVDETANTIGFVITQQILDELHLLNICVSPGFQGQGFGKRLLCDVIDYANENELSVILLEVRKSNHRAQQLYTQSGFNEVSVRKGYYPAEGGREDAVLMAMDLSFQHLFS